MCSNSIISCGAAREDREMLSQAVRERYRCPQDCLDFALNRELSSDRGYFQFGPAAICYGRSCDGVRQPRPESSLYDALRDTKIDDGGVTLPFDPNEIIDNLRLERYRLGKWGVCTDILRRIYTHLRPLTNRSLRRHIQKFWAGNWQKR